MNQLKRFFTEEDGMGTVEIVLIIVILIALVLIFKDRIIQLVNNVLDKVTDSSDEVMDV